MTFLMKIWLDVAIIWTWGLVYTEVKCDYSPSEFRLGAFNANVDLNVVLFFGKSTLVTGFSVTTAPLA